MLLATANPLLHSLPARLSLHRGRGSGAPPLRHRNASGITVNASAEASNPAILHTVHFEPFEEVKNELLHVPVLPEVSLARHVYSSSCEDVESYVYHSMYAYFDRDNVADLKGLAKFFKEASVEEREHAEKFMEYQNKRGGKVKLHSMVMSISDYDHLKKGDALNDFIESEFLGGTGVWHFDQMLLANAVAA